MKTSAVDIINKTHHNLTNILKHKEYRTECNSGQQLHNCAIYHAQSDTLTHNIMNTHTYTNTHTNTHTYTNTHTHTQTHTHTHAHTHTHTHARTRTHTLWQPLFQSLPGVLWLFCPLLGPS